MMKSKKILLTGLLVALVLVGGIVGVAFAAGTTTTTDPGNTLFAKVAAKLGVDQQKLQTAFTEAQNEMRLEAESQHLADLVSKGTITQAQADQYLTWLKSEPQVSGIRGFGGRGFAPGMPCPPPPQTQPK